jgi:putative phosphonate metabolism protein
MRYAIYFTPSSTDALLKIANNWLGRNAFTGVTVRRPVIKGLSVEELDRITVSARRYGFHATIKAPFYLAEQYEEDDLLRALMHFASSITPVTLPRLKITALGSCFALMQKEPVPALQQLANDTVTALDKFRAPLSKQDILRRKPETLTPSQLRNLRQWGYPYVFDEFRFHMTLTDKIEEQDKTKIAGILDDFFAPVLTDSVEINNLALFVEPEPGAPFEVHSLHPLAKMKISAPLAGQR